MATTPPPPPAIDANAPLPTHRIQALQLDPLQHPHGQAHLSAASGLVRVRQRLFVVADDELHLGVFAYPSAPLPGAAPSPPAAPGFGPGPGPGTLVRLLDGDLPKDKGQRKKAKPDLETLVQLPPLPGCPAGALLALGSGSRPNREAGVLVALDVYGEPNGRMALVDLAPLYAPLRKRFVDLNIEGAVVASGELLLLQRGNQGHAVNACIRFDWNLLAPWLAGQPVPTPQAKAVQLLELGCVDGVPLGLTDGAALTDGAWAFCAVAERTDNSYHDGSCVGSVIGSVGADGQVQQIHRLEGSPKVEGMVVARADGGDWLLCTLVTDPDDPAVPSQLLEVLMPRGSQPLSVDALAERR